jgi:hypothetical protein
MSYPPGYQWVTINQFTGWKTKIDPCKLDDGANPNGQNTSINDGDRVSIRQLGYTLFPTGTASSTAEPIVSMHTFRLRSGENIMMRSHGSSLDWFNRGNQDPTLLDGFGNLVPIGTGQNWELLNNGYTSADFGYADYNINADLHSYVYFGNAVQNFSRWNGVHSIVTIKVLAGTNIITLATGDGASFDAAGSVIINGTVYTFTRVGDVLTLGVNLVVDANIGNGVAEIVETTPGNPKGNIYLVSNNRLFIAGIIATPQAVYFSKYGDPLTYLSNLVTSSTATAAGIFNLGEGGGGVVNMRLDEQAIYIIKKSIVYNATLSDSFYTLTPLKPFDGRSQTIGCTYKRSMFTGGNGVFFVTPDNQILNLTRVEQYDYPQVVPISDPIKPTVENLDFSTSTGIVFRNKAYIACKSKSTLKANDTVLVWDIKNNFWESPIVGWNVSEWTIYDNGDGAGDKLYFGDAFSPNIYVVNTTPIDYIYDVLANWRSRQYDFGDPNEQKEIYAVYVEGYINSNTTLNISLLLDENGYSQTFTTAFKGTETNFEFLSGFFNLFGLNPFGFERFGSNSNVSGRKKFRLYLDKEFRANPFYNAQIEFASEGQNQGWEVVQFGFLVRKYTTPIRRLLERIFH